MKEIEVVNMQLLETTLKELMTNNWDHDVIFFYWVGGVGYGTGFTIAFIVKKHLFQIHGTTEVVFLSTFMWNFTQFSSSIKTPIDSYQQLLSV